MSSGDNGRGTQHRNIGSNSRQHVRTQPVCHELRRGRPFSRSHQDVLSYLSQPQRRRQDHSPHPSYSMGRLPLSLLLFAMQSPQLNHNSDGWMDGRWVILNSHRLPSTDVIAIIYITLTLTLLLPTLGRYLRWARSAAPFRLNALLGRVGAMRFHMNGGHVPKPLLRPGQFRIKMVFLNAQLFRRCLIIAEQLNVLVMGSATSTLSSRRRRWRRWRQTKHRESTSFLLQLLKACARSSTSRST